MGIYNYILIYIGLHTWSAAELGISPGLLPCQLLGNLQYFQSTSEYTFSTDGITKCLVPRSMDALPPTVDKADILSAPLAFQ